MTSLPPEAWVAALAGLSGMGPARLGVLLDRWGPEEAWRRVAAGTAHHDPQGAAPPTLHPGVTRRWRAEASRTDVAVTWSAHRRAGIGVASRGGDAFPEALIDDPEPPAVLFWAGDLAALGRPRVAVVGTRRCTHAGRLVARELGHDLAAAGACVVSGLALGIDGAAHAGGLAAGAVPPVAVVGTGLDVVYPRRHAQLWAQVAAVGAVISEYPLGTRPDRWRFPARNRVIAALSDVVVIVESHSRGGSLHTVDAAADRGRPVMAVPGPVRSPASAGTNDLLAAGCPPVRDAADVLVALGLDCAAAARRPPDPRPPPSDGAAGVLAAVGWEPATLDQVAERLGQSPGPVAVHLARLAGGGWLVQHGAWYQRTGPSHTGPPERTGPSRS
ncbi:MAG: DNA-processing protein DprA [Acidimicrobiales bacterium]